MTFERKGKSLEYRVVHARNRMREEKVAYWQKKGTKFIWAIILATTVDSLLALFFGQKLFHHPFVLPLILGNLAIFGILLSEKKERKETESEAFFWGLFWDLFWSLLEILPRVIIVGFVTSMITVVVATIAAMFSGDAGWNAVFHFFYVLFVIFFIGFWAIQFWMNSMPRLAKPMKKS